MKLDIRKLIALRDQKGGKVKKVLKEMERVKEGVDKSVTCNRCGLKGHSNDHGECYTREETMKRLANQRRAKRK